MAQAVLFIDGENIRQSGLMAPKDGVEIRKWSRDCLKMFSRDLAAAGLSADWTSYNLVNSRADEKTIRLGYRKACFRHEMHDVGILIDRLALWT